MHPAELNERWIVQPDDPVFQHACDVFLEITESVPLSHFQLCRSILHEVRDRGIYLVVDDLGAGYSNLKYIADLHPRVVKLDRELVAGLVRDSRLFKLVAGIVVMCRELEALVVAEGIETAIELDAVLESGAKFGQGYVLARGRRSRRPPCRGRRCRANARPSSPVARRIVVRTSTGQAACDDAKPAARSFVVPACAISSC